MNRNLGNFVKSVLNSRFSLNLYSKIRITIMTIFNFEKKVGYSEVLSLIALILSIYAFYQSSTWVQHRETKPNLNISNIAYEASNPELSFDGYTSIFLTNESKYPASDITASFALYHLSDEEKNPGHINIQLNPCYKFELSVRSEMAYLTILDPLPSGAHLQIHIPGDPAGITIYDSFGNGYFILEGKIRLEI